jgi:molecular chaperone GrpE
VEHFMAEPNENGPQTPSGQESGTETEQASLEGRIAELEAQLSAAKAEERVAGDTVRREKRELLGKVLDVMDNLERALAYQDTMDRESLQQGMRMLQWQLNELLKAEGLTAVPTVGEPFDPYVHEAVETVASSDHPEGTVVEEIRRGYKLGADTLRPARVKVSSGPEA